MRYEVIEQSQSGHCCFEATVVDTHTPCEAYPTTGRYMQVCECFDVQDAYRIADALNAAEKD